MPYLVQYRLRGDADEFWTDTGRRYDCIKSCYDRMKDFRDNGMNDHLELRVQWMEN